MVPDLEKVWENDRDECFVADCYTLNVADDEVLACPYTEFPVVRVVDRRVRQYHTRDISGPSGIIAAGDEVALIGAYRDPSVVVRGRIQDGAFHETERTRLRAPDGSTLPAAQVVCRGSVAHLFAGTEWFTFDLADDAA